MADTRRNSESDWSWFIIIGLFVIFWPIGLLTLFAKLFGPDGKSQGQQAPPLQGAASAAHTSGSATSAPAAQRFPMAPPSSLPRVPGFFFLLIRHYTGSFDRCQSPQGPALFPGSPAVPADAGGEDPRPLFPAPPRSRPPSFYQT